MLVRLLRDAFFNLAVRPVVLLVLGLNVRHRQRLPEKGPAIIVANHNSHLDTLVLMTLLPPGQLGRIRPVAAMDYFMKDRRLAWFAKNIINILPIARRPGRNRSDSGCNANPLAECQAAVQREEILIFFPEGTRGEPEQMAEFKAGIARLAEACPEVPVIPVYMHGLGKALPRGEFLLVPFFCDVFVGDAVQWQGDRKQYMAELDATMHALASEGNFQPWN